MVGALLSTVFPFSASFSYYLSISLRYFYLMWAQCVIWGVRLNRVNRGGETRSRHLVLWFRNLNIALLRRRTDLTARVQVRSLCTILGRCQAPKTARPVGQLPLIVSYILILLRAHSTLHLKHTHTHTHTNIHLSIQHNISGKNWPLPFLKKQSSILPSFRN